MEDSRPIFSCKRFSCNENTLYLFTAVLPTIPQSNFCSRVPNRPLPPRRGRFGTLLGQVRCKNFRSTVPAAEKILNQIIFQARACNTLAFRAVARSAAHRHRARRPARWPRARSGARTATLPWWEGCGEGKGVLHPPLQRLRPAGDARRPRAGPSLRRAAHLRTAGGAADTADGRACGTDRRAMGRL